ncbi:MAG: VOC family protein, partial [Thermoanaerobaculia bacterium]
AGGEEIRRKITPMLLFVGEQAGKAEEAIRFYTSVFRDASVGDVMRYGAGEGPDREGTVKFASFVLAGESFAAMDSAHPHEFVFNEAVSLIVNCENQKEIDYYWAKLSADPNAEQCGWLKDRYGVSWQIVPTAMGRMMETGTPEQIAKVTEAFLQMKKFDLAKLEAVFEGAGRS